MAHATTNNDLDTSEMNSGDSSATEETESASMDGYSDRNEMTDQMYEADMAALKRKLAQLEQGTLPEFVMRLQKLQEEHEVRRLANLAWRDVEFNVADMEHQREIAAAQKEFEEKRAELMDSLMGDLEKEKRQLELEESMSIDESSEGKDSKPGEGRKLRRRPSEIPERKKVAYMSPSSPSQMDLLLDEASLKEDLDFLKENTPTSPLPWPSRCQPPSSSSSNGSISSRVKMGRLQVKK